CVSGSREHCAWLSTDHGELSHALHHPVPHRLCGDERTYSTGRNPEELGGPGSVGSDEERPLDHAISSHRVLLHRAADSRQRDAALLESCAGNKLLFSW